MDKDTAKLIIKQFNKNHVNALAAYSAASLALRAVKKSYIRALMYELPNTFYEKFRCMELEEVGTVADGPDTIGEKLYITRLDRKGNFITIKDTGKEHAIFSNEKRTTKVLSDFSTIDLDIIIEELEKATVYYSERAVKLREIKAAIKKGKFTLEEIGYKFPSKPARKRSQSDD